jgi:hypothetical protein
MLNLELETLIQALFKLLRGLVTMAILRAFKTHAKAVPSKFNIHLGVGLSS